jgi:hypothetical protein
MVALVIKAPAFHYHVWLLELSRYLFGAQYEANSTVSSCGNFKQTERFNNRSLG